MTRSRALAGISWIVLLFLFLPLILILIVSFAEAPNLAFPPKAWSLHWYANIFQTGQFIGGFWLTCIVAFASSAIVLLVAVPGAYALTRGNFAGQGLIEALIMLPIVVPEVVIGISALSLLAAVRLDVPPYSLVGLHCILILPFVYKIVSTSIGELDREIEDAAVMLGASRFHAFFHVTLPLMARGIVVAFIFGFATSFQNFTATLFLVKSQVTLPIAIFNYIRTQSDPTIAALSSALTVLLFLAILLADRFIGVEEIVK
jgi:putative spermidine/putrescine transport system permease protein